MMQFTRALITFSFCLYLANCAAANPTPLEPEPLLLDPIQLDLPAGFTADIVPHTFNRPTQFLLEENHLWVAQLAGKENDAQGEVIQIDLITGEQTVIAQGLDKPTGLAVIGATVWIATRDAILRVKTDQPDSAPVTILDQLPTNGRSNGTLTPLPSGELLYETSGNRRDADSGKLWALDPQTLATREVAHGLKGAYAHTVEADGRIWFTEIVDGSLNGVPYPDEVNLLVDGGNYGWPACYGRELTGTDCANVIPALTTFPAGSTPTGIAISPLMEMKHFLSHYGFLEKLCRSTKKVAKHGRF